MALLLMLLGLFGKTAFAAHGDYAEAMRVRALISQHALADEAAAETVKLSVSRGFDQGGTQLCWSYATLNALEANYLTAHPGAELELSRRSMQYFTLQDRWERKIRGSEDYITERGIAVDALNLIARNGLVAFDDFGDIADPYGRDHVDDDVGAARGVDAKLAALDAGLAEYIGVPPAVTHFEGGEVARATLRERVLEGKQWESYAIARDGREGYRTHPDPDARAGARSYFMPEAKIVGKIHDALKAGAAVEITIGGHCILIYGAAYDASGKPLTYFIKDSYPDYFYEADPASTMRQLVEMTTIKIM
jgi:hypothetical protein